DPVPPPPDGGVSHVTSLSAFDAFVSTCPDRPPGGTRFALSDGSSDCTVCAASCADAAADTAASRIPCVDSSTVRYDPDTQTTRSVSAVNVGSVPSRDDVTADPGISIPETSLIVITGSPSVYGKAWTVPVAPFASAPACGSYASRFTNGYSATSHSGLDVYERGRQRPRASGHLPQIPVRRARREPDSAARVQRHQSVRVRVVLVDVGAGRVQRVRWPKLAHHIEHRHVSHATRRADWNVRTNTPDTQVDLDSVPVPDRPRHKLRRSPAGPRATPARRVHGDRVPAERAVINQPRRRPRRGEAPHILPVTQPKPRPQVCVVAQRQLINNDHG